MLSCQKMSELSSQYLDKNLPFRQRMQIKMHLLMCKHCRRFMDQLATTIKVLQRFKHVDDDVANVEISSIEAQVAILLEHHRKSKSS